MSGWDKATHHNIQDGIQFLVNFHPSGEGTHIRPLMDIFVRHIETELDQYSMVWLGCICLGLDWYRMSGTQVNQDQSHMVGIQVGQGQ